MNSKEIKKIAINDIGSKDDILKEIDKTIKYFNDGDIVSGTVVKVGIDEILVDVGYKTEGVITSKELSLKRNVNPSEVVKLGEAIEALVIQKEDKEGRLLLSKKRAIFEKAWKDIDQIKRADGNITGTVIDIVKGGLIVDIGIKGFLPASLIDTHSVVDLQQFMGQEVETKIIELDRVRNNIVLSRRALLEQSQAEVRAEFIKQLQKGQIRSGVVSSIVSFGAFINLGGIDGLVHVSELSWKHVNHPSEVVEVGQPVTVEVLEIEEGQNRVSLSLKATQEDPWQSFTREYSIGQIVSGKIVKLVPFGAFVQVDYGIEGLVHISELATQHLEKANQIVALDQEVLVKIIDINISRRRISFSLRQSNDSINPESEDFDPALYGMTTEYDEEGNYKYPDGFDPEKNEWLEGFEKERAAWEEEYIKARGRWEEHRLQISQMREKNKELEAEATASDIEREQKKRSRTMKVNSEEGVLSDNQELESLKEKLQEES